MTEIENKIFNKVYSLHKCQEERKENLTLNTHEHSKAESKVVSSDDYLEEKEPKSTKICETAFKSSHINDNKYLPLFEKGAFVFYGSKHLHVLIRFVYVLYERLYKAQEISKNFEDNDKTKKMSTNEKE